MNARHWRITSPEVEIHGATCGTGSPIVLLHGGPGCYDYLGESPVPGWLADFCTVISYDQRGCRQSPSAGPFSLESNLADLEAVHRFIGAERIRLLGHSAGAVLAAHYAAQHPLHVDHLVLVSPAGLRPGWRRAFEVELRRRHTQAQAAELHGLDARIARTRDPSLRNELYQRRFNVALPSYLDPAHREAAPTIESYSREVNVRVGASIEAVAGDGSWEQRLSEFAGRTCVIHGRSDPIPWSVVEELRELLPQAEVVGLENCGHFPWIEEPAAFRSALVAFLAPGR